MKICSKSLVERYKRKQVEDLLKRRFFVSQAFEIYGGVSGLYDYGPLGCALKNNVEQLWRNHFILEDDMLEVSSTCLTPEAVLQASGHVDKFEDFMVKDIKTGQCYRADKLLEEHIQKILNKKAKKMKPEEIDRLEAVMAQADSYSKEELSIIMKDLEVKSPDTGNDISEPTPFNLMFSTQIGPSNNSKGYFRPETAQGIFVNFKRLLEYNNGRLPFASAQIGLGFRNEISPRSGLLRVREFSMAEIEHFVDPIFKEHTKFNTIAEAKLPLLFQRNNESNQISENSLTIGEAVHGKIINNQTLGYYMSRTFDFLQLCGIPKEAIRFRQHLKNEMAHYAQDCWDAEIETSYGWIEVAGHADRACYDLNCHYESTKTPLTASRLVKQSVDDFNKEAKMIEQKFIPHVVEPSFGIGRIIYCIFEHCFRERPEDTKRTYFEFPALIAPVKASILPLVSNNEALFSRVYELKTLLNKEGVTSKVDISKVSIGKRYARTDECGIPFAITIDEETLKENTVTLREILSMRQLRIPINELSAVITNLSKKSIFLGCSKAKISRVCLFAK